ncbi:MAG: hypothetical protein U9Q82_08695 [Chloroflexota bacterium]|nr:hypothetical protein [Chloroflexota bacterium]
MYIDPSTGGMLFQVLAVLFGLFSGLILFFSSKIKMVYRRFLRSIRERKNGDADEEEIVPEN